MLKRLCITLAIISTPLSAKLLDKVIATVNGQPILLSDQNSKNTLEQLIDEQIIDQEAKKLGLYASESDLNQTINNIAKQNNLSRSKLLEALAKQGTPLAAYKKQLRAQMHKARLIQSKVSNQVNLRGQTEKRVETEHAVYDSISKAKHAKDTGNIEFIKFGDFSKSDLIESLRLVLFNLKPGEISNPILLGDRYHLFRVQKISTIPLEKVDPARYEQELDAAFSRYIQELRASASIERK